MPYVLRIGERAASSPGAVALPIEGARASIDGDALRILLAFVDPTDAERRAVDHGSIELGVFTASGVVALLLRIGVPGTPAVIEAKAPLNLFTRTTRLNGLLHGSPGSDAAPGDERLDAPLTVEIALCDSGTHLVEAVRSLPISPPIVDAVRTGARVQLATFSCAVAVDRATLHALRTATVDELMDRAVERYREAAR